MFLIGFDSYGGQIFNSKIGMETPTKLELSNGCYDEWKLDTGIVDYSDKKTLWEYYTLMLATFNNTLEAGNMANNGYEINEVHFKRRKKSNLMWTTFAKMKYDPKQKYYQVLDRMAEAAQEYEYAIQPVTNGVEGVETTKSIVHTFDDLWVMSKDDGFRLVYDVEYGDIDTITNMSTIATLENRYPYVMSTPLCYRQGTIKGKLISQTSVDNRGIDINSERQLRNRALSFLNEGSPKLLKDGNGRIMIVKIYGVKEIPHSVFAGEICDISFSYIEIGDAESGRDLENSGLIVKNY